jgi:hypothetical protein
MTTYGQYSSANVHACSDAGAHAYADGKRQRRDRPGAQLRAPLQNEADADSEAVSVKRCSARMEAL